MKEKLRLAVFGHKRWSREGGVEIVVKELCTRMAQQGCQVTCYNRAGHHVSGAEYDDGETGYLCAPTDADAFAEKIKLLSDREVRSSMQKACVEKAEEFRLEISHQQMTDIYKNLLDGQEKSK